MDNLYYYTYILKEVHHLGSRNPEKFTHNECFRKICVVTILNGEIMLQIYSSEKSEAAKVKGPLMMDLWLQTGIIPLFSPAQLPPVGDWFL